MLGLIAGGIFVGNFIRSWKTDENYASAKAKNRKATKIIQDAVEAFEEATEYAKTEQENMIIVKERAYKTLLEFVEIFKTIDDVRFRESNIGGTARISKLDTKMFSMLKEMEFSSTFTDTASVGDGLGMLSMFLPVGFGAFGSFSSLQQSKAAREEAQANIYEAECIARELESMTLLVRALGDRTKLVGNVLKGIHDLWFYKATKEFKRLVDSKNTIKYYFVDLSETSAYNDEEYAFMATLTALSKTVKTLIDAKIFDEDENESQELSPKPTIIKQVEEVKKVQKEDESFGLRATYCAQLLEGKIKADELVRPGDSFVDDFAATRVSLAQEGYESVCKFDDYLKTTKTTDSKEVRKRYFDVCDSLFADHLYQKLAKRVMEAGNKYGYGTLCVLKAALEQSEDVSGELDNLLEYVDDKSQSKLGKKGKPKFGQAGFAGLKKLVHMCLFEIEGRRNEKMIHLGEVLSQKAIEAGYKNKFLKTLPTITFYQERKCKAKPWDCVIATILMVAVALGLIRFDLFTWDSIALTSCLYLLFLVTNRKEKGILRIVQLITCFGAAGLCGHILYANARSLLMMPKFSLINGIALGTSFVLLLLVHETKEYRNLYLARVLWIITITSYVLFGIVVLEKVANVTYGVTIGAIVQMLAVLISLNGLNRKRNLKFDTVPETDVKTLAGVSVMAIPAGLMAIYVLADSIVLAGAFTVVLLVLAAVAAYVTGALSAAINFDIIKGVGILFIVGSSVLIGILFFGLLNSALSLSVTISMTISMLIYLGIACFMCYAIVAEAA